MSFNSNKGKQSYSAIAAQTEFTFNFKIYLDTDIKVYLTPVGQESNDVDDILVYPTDFTVAIDGDNGGTITLTSGATLDDTVILVRDLPATRSVSYVTQGDLLANTLNEDQDYQTYLILDQVVSISSSVQLQESSVGVSNLLPPVFADAYIKWNSTGSGLENDTDIPDNVQLAIAAAQAAGNSATSAGNSATSAGNSATSAELQAWEAQAEVLTAESYATQTEDVNVIVFTSNDDGTFTAVNTTDYSALHWAAKSAQSSQGAATNISTNTTNFNNVLSPLDTDVQKALETIDGLSSVVSIPTTRVICEDLQLSATDVELTDGVAMYGSFDTSTGNIQTQELLTGTAIITPTNGNGADGTKYYKRIEGNPSTSVRVDEAPVFGKVSRTSEYRIDGNWYEKDTEQLVIVPDGANNDSAITSVPIMTSDTAPSGEVIHSTDVRGASSSYASYWAFTGDVSGVKRALLLNSETPLFIGYKYEAPIIINKMLIGSYTELEAFKNFTIEGSISGLFNGDEVTLSTITGETNWSIYEQRTFTFNNNTEYLAYRIVVTDNNGDESFSSCILLRFVEASLTTEIVEGAILPPQSYYENPDGTLAEFEVISGDVVSIGSGGYIPSFVENKIRADEFVGKNACTAWVNFDGTTVPPTIRDSYNVSNVVRTTTGKYSIYFEEDMDNLFFTTSGSCAASYEVSNGLAISVAQDRVTKTLDKIDITTSHSTTSLSNCEEVSIQIFGGKD